MNRRNFIQALGLVATMALGRTVGGQWELLAKDRESPALDNSTTTIAVQTDDGRTVSFQAHPTWIEDPLQPGDRVQLSFPEIVEDSIGTVTDVVVSPRGV